MSNVKVNSSSDFSLAFDLSAALRLSWALPVPSPKAQRGCLVLHTPGNNSQWLLLAKQTRAKSWLSQIFSLNRLCTGYVFIHKMVPPCAIFFFYLWCSCQEGNPKWVTSKAAQSLAAQLPPFDTSHFWGLETASRRWLDLSLGIKMPLNNSTIKIVTQK